MCRLSSARLRSNNRSSTFCKRVLNRLWIMSYTECLEAGNVWSRIIKLSINRCAHNCSVSRLSHERLWRNKYFVLFMSSTKLWSNVRPSAFNERIYNRLWIVSYNQRLGTGYIWPCFVKLSIDRCAYNSWVSKLPHKWLWWYKHFVLYMSSNELPEYNKSKSPKFIIGYGLRNMSYNRTGMVACTIRNS